MIRLIERTPLAIMLPLTLLVSVGIGYVVVRYVVWAAQARTAGWASALGIGVVALAAYGLVKSPRRP